MAFQLDRLHVPDGVPSVTQRGVRGGERGLQRRESLFRATSQDTLNSPQLNCYSSKSLEQRIVQPLSDAGPFRQCCIVLPSECMLRQQMTPTLDQHRHHRPEYADREYDSITKPNRLIPESLVKSLQAERRGDPDGTISVFENRQHVIRQKAISLGQFLGLDVRAGNLPPANALQVRNTTYTVARGPDPQASLPVDQQRRGVNHHFSDGSLIRNPRNRVRRSRDLRDPDGAIRGLGEISSNPRLNHERHHGIGKPVTARRQIQHPRFRFHPESSPTIEPDCDALRVRVAPLRTDILPPLVAEESEASRSAGDSDSCA